MLEVGLLLGPGDAVFLVDGLGGGVDVACGGAVLVPVGMGKGSCWPWEGAGST